MLFGLPPRQIKGCVEQTGGIADNDKRRDEDRIALDAKSSFGVEQGRLARGQIRRADDEAADHHEQDADQHGRVRDIRKRLVEMADMPRWSNRRVPVKA